jgi:DNA-binding NtrC family response regulator
MTEPRPLRILIVDDEPGIRAMCVAIGRGLGLACAEAESAEEALPQAGNDPPDLVLADLRMGEMTGLELLAEFKRRSPRTEVSLMSAYGSIECAVEAMRLGAYDFIVKPFHVEKLRLILERMAERVRLAREVRPPGDGLPSRTDWTKALPNLCTDLEELEKLTMQRVFQQVDGDKEQAQRLLGISRATLYRKIKRYGIQTRQNGQKVPVRVVRGERERMILLSQT